MDNICLTIFTEHCKYWSGYPTPEPVFFNEILGTHETQHPIELFVSIFLKPARANEILHCLRMNLENPHIQTVHALLENTTLPPDLAKHPKLRMYASNYRWRVKQSDLYTLIPEDSKSINLIANSDIIFSRDELLQLYRMEPTDFATLSRWEVQSDNQLLPFEEYAIKAQQTVNIASSDTWICVGKPHVFADIQLGIPGCENMLVMDFSNAGYRILNLGHLIPNYHIHRNQNSKFSYPFTYQEVPTYRLAFVSYSRNPVMRDLNTDSLHFQLEKETQEGTNSAFFLKLLRSRWEFEFKPQIQAYIQEGKRKATETVERFQTQNLDAVKREIEEKKQVLQKNFESTIQAEIKQRLTEEENALRQQLTAKVKNEEVLQKNKLNHERSTLHKQILEELRQFRENEKANIENELSPYKKKLEETLDLEQTEKTKQNQLQLDVIRNSKLQIIENEIEVARSHARSQLEIEQQRVQQFKESAESEIQNHEKWRQKMEQEKKETLQFMEATKAKIAELNKQGHEQIQIQLNEYRDRTMKQIQSELETYRKQEWVVVRQHFENEITREHSKREAEWDSEMERRKKEFQDEMDRKQTEFDTKLASREKEQKQVFEEFHALKKERDSFEQQHIKRVESLNRQSEHIERTRIEEHKRQVALLDRSIEQKRRDIDTQVQSAQEKEINRVQAEAKERETKLAMNLAEFEKKTLEHIYSVKEARETDLRSVNNRIDEATRDLAKIQDEHRLKLDQLRMVEKFKQEQNEHLEQERIKKHQNDLRNLDLEMQQYSKNRLAQIQARCEQIRMETESRMMSDVNAKIRELEEELRKTRTDFHQQDLERLHRIRVEQDEVERSQFERELAEQKSQRKQETHAQFEEELKEWKERKQETETLLLETRLFDLKKEQDLKRQSLTDEFEQSLEKAKIQRDITLQVLHDEIEQKRNTEEQEFLEWAALKRSEETLRIETEVNELKKQLLDKQTTDIQAEVSFLRAQKMKELEEEHKAHQTELEQKRLQEDAKQIQELRVSRLERVEREIQQIREKFQMELEAEQKLLSLRETEMEQIRIQTHKTRISLLEKEQSTYSESERTRYQQKVDENNELLRQTQESNRVRAEKDFQQMREKLHAQQEAERLKLIQKLQDERNVLWAKIQEEHQRELRALEVSRKATDEQECARLIQTRRERVQEIENAMLERLEKERNAFHTQEMERLQKELQTYESQMKRELEERLNETRKVEELNKKHNETTERNRMELARTERDRMQKMLNEWFEVQQKEMQQKAKQIWVEEEERIQKIRSKNNAEEQERVLKAKQEADAACNEYRQTRTMEIDKSIQEQINFQKTKLHSELLELHTQESNRLQMDRIKQDENERNQIVQRVQQEQARMREDIVRNVQKEELKMMNDLQLRIEGRDRDDIVKREAEMRRHADSMVELAAVERREQELKKIKMDEEINSKKNELVDMEVRCKNRLQDVELQCVKLVSEAEQKKDAILRDTEQQRQTILDEFKNLKQTIELEKRKAYEKAMEAQRRAAELFNSALA